MLRISDKITIPDEELKEEFFQSSGHGGQNVNIKSPRRCGGVLTPPRKRRPTRPTQASVKRRIDSKKKHGTIKKYRTAKSSDD